MRWIIWMHVCMIPLGDTIWQLLWWWNCIQSWASYIEHVSATITACIMIDAMKMHSRSKGPFQRPFQAIFENGYTIWHVSGREIARLQTGAQWNLCSSDRNQAIPLKFSWYPQWTLQSISISLATLSGGIPFLACLWLEQTHPENFHWRQNSLQSRDRAIIYWDQITHFWCSIQWYIGHLCSTSHKATIESGPGTPPEASWMGTLINLESHFQEVPIPIEFFPRFDPDNFKVQFRRVC
jgi:hypothetical protein